MTDRDDTAQPLYTTTPAEDRVSSADGGKYEPVELPSAREDVTGQFDHLATRDPAAMEHQLQAPDHVGAETVAGLADPALLNALGPAGGVGVNASVLGAQGRLGADADLNPGYTPPAESGPPHPSERAGDLPDGETAELQSQIDGQEFRR